MLDLRSSRNPIFPAGHGAAAERRAMLFGCNRRDSVTPRAYKGRPAAKPASSPAVKAAPPKPAPKPEPPKPAEPAKEQGEAKSS